MNKKLIPTSVLNRKEWWDELHDSEIARKHKGELTKARKTIQEDIETKCYA